MVRLLPFSRESNLFYFPKFLWMPYLIDLIDRMNREVKEGWEESKCRCAWFSEQIHLHSRKAHFNFIACLRSSERCLVRSTHSFIRRGKRKDRLAQCLYCPNKGLSHAHLFVLFQSPKLIYMGPCLRPSLCRLSFTYGWTQTWNSCH